MISEHINNVKDFMSRLLVGNDFDIFEVVSVSITTFNTFTIDGHVHKNFYSKDEYDALSEKNLSLWKSLKPFCYNVIKGHNTPLKLKIIFKMPDDITKNIAAKTELNIENIEGLFLNISFENDSLTCVTGTSLKILDFSKDTEKEFDRYISSFVSTHFS